MIAEQFLHYAERDAVVIDALRTALVATELTHGASIRLEGVAGTLDFQRQLGKLRVSLYLLGAGTNRADATKPI